MSSTGARVVERYIKHPAAASGWTDDGAALDAGSAHVAHSNVSHLAHRNVRLVGHATGLGDITYTSTVSDPWAAAIDVDQPSSPDAWGAISWSRPANALLFGPVALAHNRLGTAPAGFYPRKIRVVVQGHKTATWNTELYVLAALTAGTDTPLRSPRLAGTTAFITDSDAGPYTFSLEVSLNAPVRPAASWRCRAGGMDATQVALTPAWVWVGWHTNTTVIAPDRLESVSVFEVWS